MLMAELTALFQVLIIDLVLAADNAVIVGLAVQGLHGKDRRMAIFVGIGAATVLRIFFALVTVQLLAIIGLMLAGGLLLLWVCWKMYRELKRSDAAHGATQSADGPKKSLRQAMMQIVLADVSMSLDNVLAVAGAAQEHPRVLVLGLAISVVLMGLAANMVAKLLDRYRWIAWIGLLIVLYVAGSMIYKGSMEVMHATG